MNYNMIIYILGNLMKVEGCLMIVPLFIAIAKTENAFRTWYSAYKH